jgi:hypothetical protein
VKTSSAGVPPALCKSNNAGKTPALLKASTGIVFHLSDGFDFNLKFTRDFKLRHQLQSGLSFTS